MRQVNTLRWLTYVQVIWFSLSTMSRLIQDLHVTALEVTTVAFVFAMMATSLAWYHKPMDITSSISIESKTSVRQILTAVSP